MSDDQDQLSARIKALAPNLSSQECVALAMSAAGISGTVRDWRKGDSATGNRLPIGTPVATFLDRNGKPSDLYDGGGIGKRGNNTTHAGVVAGYTPDGDVMLWSQSAGVPPPFVCLQARGPGRRHTRRQ